LAHCHGIGPLVVDRFQISLELDPLRLIQPTGQFTIYAELRVQLKNPIRLALDRMAHWPTLGAHHCHLPHILTGRFECMSTEHNCLELNVKAACTEQLYCFVTKFHVYLPF
tara:strand:+ start:7603 stop:7935 length:333 start_codon:yes stop_codon:yes gene_type:complete